MTDGSMTREGFLKQWSDYGYPPEKVKQLINEGRITSKSLFIEFAHWYVDGQLMFAEYHNKEGNYEYIPYRKREM